MSESIKNFLVVLNKYEKKTDTPRIKTTCFILKAPAIPETSELKTLFKNAVIDGVLSTPKELQAAKSDPDYKVTWADVHRLPEKSLQKYGLRVYDPKTLPSFNDVVVLNVNIRATFDLSKINDA